MAIIKFDEPVKSFAQTFVEQMNRELEKQVQEIVDKFVEDATKQIKQKASEISIKAGQYLMTQCVMLPCREGYEVRIFVNHGEKER